MSDKPSVLPNGKSNRLPPHPLLTDYYPTEEQRRGIIIPLFDRIAPDYDWIIQAMSFGSGRWHRGKTLHRVGLRQGMKVLDVACGPGTVGRCAIDLVGPNGCVVGLDPSRGMLQQAKRNSLQHLTQGLAEHLPFHDSTFDFVTMGYALRHVSDLQHTFGEYWRVLKPGGSLLILEIARPHSRIQFHLAKFFLKTVVPLVTQLKTRNQQAPKLMRYFWDTIENCVSADQIIIAMEKAGFVRSGVSELAGGLIRDYTASKSVFH